MGIKKLTLLIAPLTALLLAGTACHTEQRQAKLPRPQANAPAMTAAVPTAPASVPQKESVPKPAPAETVQTAPQVKPDAAADLIANADKEYQVGQEKFKAGDLEAAKRNFDRAVDLLLQSPAEVRSDERVQHELERVLEGVNRPEMAALQSDNPAPQQKAEPAPIDEVNDVTPPVDPNVKARAEAEVKATHSDLPLMLTDQVAGFINYFSTPKGHEILQRALERGGRYREMIESTLREEGVPQELIYLAQAESGFHPLALSRVGARGMWQFMASRARGYGLQRSLWVDERQDPEKATRAAAHHLKDLYQQFGDWYLAMAAYNSGPGTVQSAVKRTGYADFWELYRRNVLPKETRNYVPIIVAVTIMAKNPAQYGLDSVVKEKPVPYDTVQINYPIDLRLAAECVDATAEDLLDLNPSLLRLTTPKFSDKDGEFDLHLPAGTAGKFQTAVASIPADKRVWWRYHKVQGGETLASIARTYHTTPRAIAEANDLESGGNSEALSPEARLIIPIAPGKQIDTSTYAHATTHYKIRGGDTVESVAENFGVSARMLRVWNRLKGSSLAGRRILYLHLPVTRSASEMQVVSKRSSGSHHLSARTQTATVTPTKTTTPNAVLHHSVKRGETLSSIATSYNTTVSALKHDNRNIAALRPGMILVVHSIN